MECPSQHHAVYNGNVGHGSVITFYKVYRRNVDIAPPPCTDLGSRPPHPRCGVVELHRIPFKRSFAGQMLIFCAFWGHWDIFEVILVSLRDHFGVVLASFWVRLGAVSGSFWDTFWVVLELFWGHFAVHFTGRSTHKPTI